jgi:hypothetical protein
MTSPQAARYPEKPELTLHRERRGIRPGEIKKKLSPFTLCRKLLINASRSAYDELLLLQAAA